ncbi:hypothetical protein B0T10DRAFT_463195 [Thelonectria olida]|uniref:Uncharacterized protein n=1 Tax=Thelonectria olida TaxID=1576542 RepID=A0A9P8VWR0_9HYPO|nr:hypothetical protein B0T10DRAFT_463195 [Thelonectria olida]
MGSLRPHLCLRRWRRLLTLLRRYSVATQLLLSYSGTTQARLRLKRQQLQLTHDTGNFQCRDSYFTIDCSPMLNSSTWMASAHYDKLLSLDMMRSVDAHEYNYSATNAKSIGLPHDKDRVVISSNCPNWAPVCERNNSLRVDIDFWVKQSDSGIASKTASENAE